MQVVDLIASVLGLVLLSPLFALIALLVKVSSSGPVFHRARRAGKGGKIFRLFKFRSMVVDAERIGPGITTSDDPRITRVGHFLRQTKLDELPQLINVVKGEMSLVGPRPEDPRYVALYTAEQRRVLQVRPGITSPASLRYRSESSLLAGADWERVYAEQILPEKLASDLAYLRDRSFFADLRIILETVGAVFRPDGSAEDRPGTHVAYSSKGDRRHAMGKGNGRAWRMVIRVGRGLKHYGPAIALDGLVAILCFAAALILRFGGRISPYYFGWFPIAAPVAALTFCTCTVAFNLYRRDWRYASLPDLSALTGAVAGASAVLILADQLIFPLNHPVPLSVIPIAGTLAFVGFGLIKFAPRLRRFLASGTFPQGRMGVVIVGAGQAGQRVARELLSNRELNYQPVCYVDDDERRLGLRIHGVPVRGATLDIPRLVQDYHASVVALAIPSATSAQLRAVVDICHPLPVRLLIVPGIRNILRGGDRSDVLREIRIDDILGRDPVYVDLDACRSYLAGKVALITGAAGSIGSELSRQVLALDPATLILYDTNESGLHDLALELGDAGPATRVLPVVGSTTDAIKVDSLFRDRHPDVVFHAAAYKHVPLMEEYPEEAIAVNVLGTNLVCLAAHQYGVERFVLVSTDKAVNPLNVMGATKRLAELVVKNRASTSYTRFCAVRFGNVLGSRGSVVPLFTRQIDKGGPITITHPDMTRYFMTIPEAVRLIIQAGSFAGQGDVFMLDMGEPIRIVELAEKMVRLRGLRVGKDIELIYTGLRPGEKLTEQLATAAETVHPTAHPKVLRLSDDGVSIDPSAVVSRLQQAITNSDGNRVKAALFDLVPDRSPAYLEATW